MHAFGSGLAVSLLASLLVAASPAQAQLTYSSTLSTDGQQFTLKVNETSTNGALWAMVNSLNAPAKSTAAGFAKSFALSNGQLTIDCYVTNGTASQTTACTFGVRNGNVVQGGNNWTIAHVSSEGAGHVAHVVCSGTFEQQAHALWPAGTGAGGAYQLNLSTNAFITYSDGNGAAEMNFVSDQ